MIDQDKAVEENGSMQRMSEAHFVDQSLAYLAGIVTVLFFGLAAFAVSSADLDLSLSLDDEVKVEAAQFTPDNDPDMSIFAAGCNGKSTKTLCEPK